MMTISGRLFILVIWLIVFVQCGGQSQAFKVKKGKAGGLYELSATGKIYQSANDDQSYTLDTATYISFNDFEKIKKEKWPYGGDIIVIRLNESGRSKFEEMTKRNLGKQICFVIKDKIISAPIITNTISGGELNLSLSDKKVTEEIMNYLKE